MPEALEEQDQAQDQDQPSPSGGMSGADIMRSVMKGTQVSTPTPTPTPAPASKAPVQTPATPGTVDVTDPASSKLPGQSGADILRSVMSGQQGPGTFSDWMAKSHQQDWSDLPSRYAQDVQDKVGGALDAIQNVGSHVADVGADQAARETVKAIAGHARDALAAVGTAYTYPTSVLDRKAREDAARAVGGDVAESNRRSAKGDEVGVVSQYLADVTPAILTWGLSYLGGKAFEGAFEHLPPYEQQLRTKAIKQAGKAGIPYGRAEIPEVPAVPPVPAAGPPADAKAIVEPTLQGALRNSFAQSAADANTRVGAAPGAVIPGPAAATPIRELASNLQMKLFNRAKATYDALTKAVGSNWGDLEDEVKELRKQEMHFYDIDDAKAENFAAQADVLEYKGYQRIEAAVKRGDITPDMGAQADADWRQQIALAAVDKALKRGFREASTNVPEASKGIGKVEDLIQKMKDDTRIDQAGSLKGKKTSVLGRALGSENAANDLAQQVRDFRDLHDDIAAKEKERVAATSGTPAIPAVPATGEQRLLQWIGDSSKMTGTLFKGGKAFTDWGEVLKNFGAMSDTEKEATFGPNWNRLEDQVARLQRLQTYGKWGRREAERVVRYGFLGEILTKGHALRPIEGLVKGAAIGAGATTLAGPVTMVGTELKPKEEGQPSREEMEMQELREAAGPNQPRSKATTTETGKPGSPLTVKFGPEKSAWLRFSADDPVGPNNETVDELRAKGWTDEKIQVQIIKQGTKAVHPPASAP